MIFLCVSCLAVEKLLVVGSKDTMMITTIIIEIEVHIMEIMEGKTPITIVIHTMLPKETATGTISRTNMDMDRDMKTEIHMKTGE
jgi:hypothetical protein